LQTITVESEVIGTLKSQLITYQTKEQKFDLTPVKTRNWGVYAGLNFDFQSVGAEILLAKPKTIYTVGMDLQQNINVGIAFKLF